MSMSNSSQAGHRGHGRHNSSFAQGRHAHRTRRGRTGARRRGTNATGTLHATPILKVNGHPEHLSAGHVILLRAQRMITCTSRRRASDAKGRRISQASHQRRTPSHGLSRPTCNARRRNGNSCRTLVRLTQNSVYLAFKVSTQRRTRRYRGHRQRHTRHQYRPTEAPAISNTTHSPIHKSLHQRTQRRRGIHYSVNSTRDSRHGPRTQQCPHKIGTLIFIVRPCRLPYLWDPWADRLGPT